MALNTYANLKTAIATWLDRSDLTSYIPDFITLAEARINRDLRIRAMEARSLLTLSDGNKYYGLPTGYLQMRNIQINDGSNIIPLEYITPEMMDRFKMSDLEGRPVAYTIIGDELLFAPTPDSTKTVEVAYYKKLTTLGDGTGGTATSNWLTTDAPDVLLYGSLLEAEPFVKNDERIPVWLAGYDNAINKLQDADDRDRHSGSTMRVRNVYIQDGGV